ncbi:MULTISPECIES: hypothetical protein [Pontibacillus]|uniref:Uncharacterized protein n=1 Tax=Pontibacillus chungwhensis TaxID=265426 RepID=A0ABY8UZG9_9BACI|nr:MULTISPECIES: hypothetical protein [Pontibacillus]MCD5324775.1 hypothetical protein [Pontibacillus sp. HN14]WIF98735.1 hypothetical protein QNI29_03525 [Pontibacillus chungwhensis]
MTKAEKNEVKTSTNRTRKIKDKQMVYVGPNLLQLNTYTVFKGPVPKHVESLIQKQPAVEKLIVPVEQLREAEQASKTKGTLEHRYRTEIEEWLRKGDK